ncbi:lysozyme inhibitor LprI family protein [Sphingobium nicotianae]|uniref:DUF1311 domain-containing protein n=1 Tax=Sphingobium nicotianae TaxID=2782607 RepID=A0A9X1AJE3_9SPHN|nr:hypothetical protein [Sphingobium nicotianae]MBT2185939.1 hypothetical protein [Sphingobium nicotianae]
MKIGTFWLIATPALLAMGSPAQARGIDCARASTKLEKIICADPTLLDYDGRIAAAYANALTVWKGAIAAYVRRDQAAWLQQFRAIGTADSSGGCTLDDKACIRDEMHSRVDAIESGAYANSGVYLAPDGRKLLLTPRRANDYALRLFQPAGLPDAHIASQDDPGATMWDGQSTLVTRMGDGNGLPFPKPKDTCALRIALSSLSATVSQTGACGGRSYAGTYRRDLAQTLADYEFDLH